MAKCVRRDESLISRAITLFPGDTVLAALQVMQRYALAVLPVVDEERGELVGEVTEAELCRVASRLPLIPIAEVLTAKALGGQEVTTGVAEGWQVALEGEHAWLH
ncbi:CBS domain-containing protein [Hyalangium rubrum]|uniref:CBS domain-containing protein n=1 Tax=Hyalangium rubrum TaxID=3103134 RepID=A0ABU5H987_9BACT|nr:CBS domain-containing protein [Hyalangium sp. s54d21]MDY7230057.1 CBS domain-containing protein [Hyalangium sp. s54d21]